MKRIILTERQVELISEDSSNYYTVPQIRYNGEIIQWSEFEAQPFFGYIDGQCIMTEIGGEHMIQKNRRLFQDKDLCLIGRMFETADGKLICVYSKEGNSADFLNNSILFEIIRKAFDKTELQGNSYYYTEDGSMTLNKIQR